MPRPVQSILLSILMALLLGANAYAQENCLNGIDDDDDGFIDLNDPEGCNCQSGDGAGEFVTNGDLEEFTCCPTSFSNFDCAVGYFTPSDATTDYFNTCGFMGGGALPPPPAFPDGEGCAGFAVSFVNGFAYREYVANCLEQPLSAGNTYTLTFDLAGAPEFPASSIQASDFLEFGFYASTNCFESWVDYDCPTVGSGLYDEVLTSDLTVTPNGWTNYSFTFTAADNYAAIALGAQCDISINGVYYFFMDNISISQDDPVDIDPPTFSVSGDGCSGYTLTADQTDFNTYQWYLDGIAITGANDLTYTIPPGAQGDYSLGVFDGGCAFSTVFTPEPPNEISVTTQIEDEPVCFDSTTTISLDVAPPSSYNYQWSNGDSGSSIIAEGGTYQVTITDADGCADTIEVTVEESPELTAIFTLVEPVDPFTGLGIGNVEAFGGTPEYTYLWSDGVTGPDNFNLMPGPYEVTVTDANGCREIIEFEIPPAELVVQIIPEDESCFGTCDGSATPLVYGGTPPYFFDWSNGSNDSIIQDLCAGSYSLVINDAGGQAVSGNVTILQPDALSLSGDVENITCDQPGSVSVEMDNGLPPYQYTWNNALTEPTIEVNIPGTYTVTVTDDNGCTVVESFDVTSFSDLTFSVSQDTPTCENPEALVEITPFDGLEPYEIIWEDAVTQFTRDDLSSGSYTFTITDQSDCSIVGEVNVPVINGFNVSIQIDSIECFDGTGVITASPENGNEPYSYNWDTGAESQTLPDAPSGAYVVTVTDNEGCEVIRSVFLPQPDQLTLDIVETNASCRAAEDGRIELSASGGNAPYNFTIDGVATNAIFETRPGNFEIRVEDANGCTLTDSTLVAFDDPTFSYSISAVNPNCGEANGSIGLDLGSPSYTVLWTNGETDPLLDDLSAGTYAFTITDSLGCSVTDSASLSNPSSLTLGLQASDESCEGASDGAITLAVSDETGVTYQWSHGPDTRDVNTLAPGNYQVTITDANGCDTVLTSIIEPGIDPELRAVIDSARCFGDSSFVSLSANSGIEPYTYQWADGFDQSQRAIDADGTFSVTVTDDNDCRDELTFEIAIPDSINIAPVSIIQPDALSGIDGSIDIDISGGTPPIAIEWSNGSTDEDLSDLEEGTYSVTATDANGCAETLEFTLTDNSAISIITDILRNSCPGECDGQVEITVNASIPTEIVWEDGTRGAFRDELCPGDYTYYVRNSDGMDLDTIELTIAGYPTIQALVTVEDETCSGADNGSITVAVPSPDDYSIQWTGGLSGFAPQFIAPGSYAFAITDTNMCVLTDTVEVGEVNATTPNTTVVPGVCDQPGWLILNGPDTLDYFVSNQPLLDSLNLQAGTYTIVQIISAQCTSVVDQVEITSGGSLDIAIDAGQTQLTTSESSTLRVTNVSNTSTLASITWTVDGDTLCSGSAQQCEELEFLSDIPGSFQISVMVEDEFGCMDVDQVLLLVEQPESDIFIPNAFSPNDDGVNDVFRPYFEDGTWNILDFRIYNRWGGKVFDMNQSPINEWDGTANNQRAPVGVYTYMISLENQEGEIELRKGDILLAR